MTKEEALREENELCDLEKQGTFSLGRTVTGGRPTGERAEKASLEPLKGRSSTLIISGIVSSGNIALGFDPAMVPFSTAQFTAKTETHRLGA